VFKCPCYGVVLDGSKVLLLERPEPHVWEFPGGNPEKGETLRDAVEREVHEETGLKVKPGLLVPVREADDTVAMFGLCQYSGGEVVLDQDEDDEKLDHKWVELAGVPPKIGGVRLARSVQAFLKELGHY
jgi:8-oxo-dGTP diphosphatase